jgi:hypothetical protein
LEKPPAERLAPVSGEAPEVAPTRVTKGQVGKVGRKGLLVQLSPGVAATPPSPLANRIETPRAASCMYESHMALKREI